jgi:mRNA interferase MazF
MLRKECWWLNFEPSIGGEIKKQRPAVIISNEISNKYLNRMQVIPLSTNIDKVYPSETIIVVNGKKQKAMADQITTVSKSRFINFIGKISDDDMQKIENVIKIQLGLL